MSKTYRIQTPDGKELQVEGPDDATDDELIAFAHAHVSGQFKGSPVDVRHTQDAARSTVASLPKPESSLTHTLLNGATLGTKDEIDGVLGAGWDALVSPFSSKVDFNPAASYRAHRDYDRAISAETYKQHPWAAPASELAGGVMFGGRQGQGALQGPGVSGNLGSTMLQGLTAGAKMGAAAGWGYGEGLDNSIAGSGLGALTGGALGGVLPLAARLVSTPVKAAFNYMRPQPGIGRQLVGKALRDDAVPPSEAAQRIADANSRGVPLALGDLGENLRGLTGAVSRAPGPSRRLVRQMLETRQSGQGERVRGAIETNLGPIAHVAAASDDLGRQAQAAAAPLYQRAYAEPGRTSDGLEALLSTPAGRGALARARTIAANEQRDPRTLGFDLNDQGETILTHVPSVQTLDYVKRALDDLVENFRDPVTRRLHLDEAGRAIDGVRHRFVAEVDRLHPNSYAAARRAYQGPARERDALNMGQKLVGATADEVERATTGLSDSERQQLALGYRSKLAEDLDRRVAGGNKVGALIGTPRKQQALGQLFGDAPGFDRFSQTLGDEALAHETYRTVMTGSPTANRLADDAAVSDPSLIEDVAGKAAKGMVNGGLTGMVINGISAFGDATKRFGAGATGHRAREDAAALLTEIDPMLLRQSLSEGLRQAARGRIASRTFNRHVRTAGMLGSRGLGAVSGYSLQPADE